MSNYPDDLAGWQFCRIEGHDWGAGSACLRCDARLRCVCGCFMRADGFDAHEKKCRVLTGVGEQTDE